MPRLSPRLSLTVGLLIAGLTCGYALGKSHAPTRQPRRHHYGAAPASLGLVKAEPVVAEEESDDLVPDAIPTAGLAPAYSSANSPRPARDGSPFRSIPPPAHRPLRC